MKRSLLLLVLFVALLNVFPITVLAQDMIQTGIYYLSNNSNVAEKDSQGFSGAYKVYTVPLDIDQAAIVGAITRDGRITSIEDAYEFAWNQRSSGKWIYAYEEKNLLDPEATEAGQDRFIRFFGDSEEKKGKAEISINWSPLSKLSIKELLLLLREIFKSYYGKSLEWDNSTEREGKVDGFPAIGAQFKWKRDSLNSEYCTLWVVKTKFREYAILFSYENSCSVPDNAFVKVKGGIRFIEPKP